MQIEFDTNGVPCSPCMAPLHSPAERLEILRNRIAEETDPLVTLTHLLHLCRDEHRVLWEQAADPELREATARVLDPIRTLAESRPAEATVNPLMREALAQVLAPANGAAPVMIAHALAQFLDDHYGEFLTASFRRRSPYQPAVGDPIPLGGPDIRAVIDMRPTSPPWRLANRLDETRRVQLAGGWATQFRIVFDYSLFGELAGVVTGDTIIATCHPNRELTEFDLPSDSTQPAFPVRPTHVDDQQAVLDQLIGGALEAGASIVVLPELCVTEPLSHRMQRWVHHDNGLKLMVAGSYHHTEGPPPRRCNTAIAWLRGQPKPLTHDKHSPAQHPILEDIQPQGWPEWRVYVSCEGWHIVIAVCRDLLNPQAVHALTEAGANLVLVPAMSESLTPFTGQIAHLVSSGQALVAVANNPALWADAGGHDRHRPARALFGHPGMGQQTRLVASPDSAPGFATMTVRSALIGWTSLSRGEPPEYTALSQGAAPGRLPQWAQSLAATVSARYPQLLPAPQQTVTLRPAAVLVLLTDGPGGVHVLLSERSSDLGDPPERLTFPGGVCDQRDADPISTALREANEEVGLDPASVQLLGVLPAFTDPELKFLVTPVLVWSGRPEFTAPMNLAEVTSVHQVALQGFAARGRADQSEGQSLSPAAATPPLPRLGHMTGAVIDSLLALLTNDVPEPQLGTRQNRF